MEALGQGSLRIALMLLEMGADVNQANRGQTFLSSAIVSRNVNMVKLLTSVPDIDIHFGTPLQTACTHSANNFATTLDIFDVLIGAGADPYYVKPGERMSAISTAELLNNKDIEVALKLLKLKHSGVLQAIVFRLDKVLLEMDEGPQKDNLELLRAYLH